MKARFTVLVSILFCTISFAQPFYSDFEDGTLQGWSNIDNSTTLLTVEGNSSNLFLQKECDGSNSPVGEMTIINSSTWSGNYFYEAVGEEYLINIDEIYLKNDNDFDLHIRYGFTGANGYMVITTDPIIVTALSDWDFYGQSFGIDYLGFYNLTVINDTTGLPYDVIHANVRDLFEDVVEFRILHNEDVSFEGQNVTGSLQIEDIFSYILLSNEDQDLSKTKLYPNPVNNIVQLRLPYESNGTIIFYNVLGEKVLSKEFSLATTPIDVSELKSGIYLAKIETENQSTVKKIVKI